MMPRKQLDIGWADLLAGAAGCVGWRYRTSRPGGLAQRDDRLVCLSVRSGLDLLLTELAWPAGTEVLVSAITIPDISRILQEHGIVPVPVDIDPETLQVDEAAWARACTPRTRAMLATHLFGGRLPLDNLLHWAQTRGLMVWEDAAQAFAGDGWCGHERSDIRMFSFGPIKTATALGGGVLLVRDAGLRVRLHARHAQWPVQPTGQFFRRVLKFSFFKPLLSAPGYTLLSAGLRLLGRHHDEAVTTFGRGFAGGDFFRRLRHRPSAALVNLLARRLATYDAGRVRSRAATGAAMQARLDTGRLLGAATPGLTYWLFPLRVADREKLLPQLWAEGIDATVGASSLTALSAASGHVQPVAAQAAMAQVLYVPVYPAMGEARLAHLAARLNALARPPA